MNIDVEFRLKSDLNLVYIVGLCIATAGGLGVGGLYFMGGIPGDSISTCEQFILNYVTENPSMNMSHIPDILHSCRSVESPHNTYIIPNT